MTGAWPAIVTSTARDADTAYGIWRACFEGYVQKVQGYLGSRVWETANFQEP